MDAVSVQRMFQTFNQADRSLDRSRGGLGLGMALVKHLVELHDGAVQARSDGVGHGTEIVIRIPVELVDAPSSTAVASPQAVDRILRILVIEDNVDAAESLCILLNLKGHVTEKAGSGPTGIMANTRENRRKADFSDVSVAAYRRRPLRAGVGPGASQLAEAPSARAARCYRR